MAERAHDKATTAPHPDDARKPDELSDIQKPAWKYVFKRTVHEFSHDKGPDLAAALTYFGVLALFPALLAVVSILGLFANPQQAVDQLLAIAQSIAGEGALSQVEEPIRNIATSGAAGFAFVGGLVGAVLSASGFVRAFSRASNDIYEVEEGRPGLKLRLQQVGLTLVLVVLVVIAAVLVVFSGPVAEAVGSAIGLGEVALTVWSIAKWPVVVAIAIVVIALLYYFGPNVQQPAFRWVSAGSLFALVVWLVASTAFGIYVANFADYDRIYGSLAGVIIFLLWLWISNIALVFGAELDAELERGRQLQGGIAAEETIQLPPRGTAKSEKQAEKYAGDVLEGYKLRKANERAREQRKPASPFSAKRR